MISNFSNLVGKVADHFRNVAVCIALLLRPRQPLSNIRQGFFNLGCFVTGFKVGGVDRCDALVDVEELSGNGIGALRQLFARRRGGVSGVRGSAGRSSAGFEMLDTLPGNIQTNMGGRAVLIDIGSVHGKGVKAFPGRGTSRKHRS